VGSSVTRLNVHGKRRGCPRGAKGAWWNNTLFRVEEATMTEKRPVLRTELCDVLGIEYPIIQSGMGGVAGAELAAEVCNAGGLGVIAALLTAPDELRRSIRELRERTDRPFGVNLLLLPEIWDPQPTSGLDVELVESVHAIANPLREELGLEPLTERPPTVPQLVDAAFDVIVEERVPVFSAGLGDPGPDVTARLHEAGTRTVVMVTNSGDARRAVDSGADVIVAQGMEAGGHRSHFEMPPEKTLRDLGTFTLVPEVVDAVDVPVVAAGGVIDGRGLVAALALGATGVLMGSRFLVTRESMAPDVHKKRLLEGRGEETLVTAGLTGRPARVVQNTISDAWTDATALLPFPAQFLVNADVFALGESRHEPEHLPLWAGQAIGRITGLPWAGDVVADTVRQAVGLLGTGIAVHAEA
jgi:nitronate monooxygenase